MEINFFELEEKDLEEVAKLYAAERSNQTNREKMYQTF